MYHYTIKRAAGAAQILAQWRRRVKMNLVIVAK